MPNAWFRSPYRCTQQPVGGTCRQNDHGQCAGEDVYCDRTVPLRDAELDAVKRSIKVLQDLEANVNNKPPLEAYHCTSRKAETKPTPVNFLQSALFFSG